MSLCSWLSCGRWSRPVGNRSTENRANSTGSCRRRGRHPASGLTPASWYSLVISSCCLPRFPLYFCWIDRILGVPRTRRVEAALAAQHTPEQGTVHVDQAEEQRPERPSCDPQRAPHQSSCASPLAAALVREGGRAHCGINPTWARSDPISCSR